MDTDAGQVEIASVELCFGYDSNDESRGKIDYMGDVCGWRAIAAAIPSIVVEDWHGGKWSSWCQCCCCSVAATVAVGCFVLWRMDSKSRRRSAVVGFMIWSSLRSN